METLEYNKNRFRKSYSEELANMLNYMLGEDPSSRPEWIELENYVITDNTSKSFISEGRKSNIIGHSKPVSVNLNHKNNLSQASQPATISQSNVNVPVGLPGRASIAQKTMTEQKPVYTNSTVLNKGIGISSLKPLSVQNYQNPIQTSTFMPKYP